VYFGLFVQEVFHGGVLRAQFVAARDFCFDAPRECVNRVLQVPDPSVSLLELSAKNKRAEMLVGAHALKECELACSFRPNAAAPPLFWPRSLRRPAPLAAKSFLLATVPGLSRTIVAPPDHATRQRRPHLLD
jgi:hypothetical protein